jgi:TRAP-type C4-dicarboxylate transport system permease small subunit
VQNIGVLDRLHKCLFWFLMVLACVMLVIGFMQVIWRYVLEASLYWSEELLRYMYVWVIFLGTSVAIRGRLHVSIDAFVNLLKGRPLHMLKTVIHLLTVAFFALVVVIGVQFTLHNLGQVSPAVRLPMSVAYLAIPLGGLFSLIFTLEDWRKARQEGVRR